jgi:plasmid stabilization system protein ParE
MYALTEEATGDIKNILERSITDFGLQQTELYYNSLKNCLELMGINPAMGSVAATSCPDTVASHIRAM